MTRIEIIDCLRAWLVEHNPEIDIADITEDTLIIEEGILSSLQVASLLLYLEQMRGEPIDIGSLRSRTFSSLATIYHNFFAGPAHA